jgi:hypothetical protein
MSAHDPDRPSPPAPLPLSGEGWPKGRAKVGEGQEPQAEPPVEGTGALLPDRTGTGLWAALRHAAEPTPAPPGRPDRGMRGGPPDPRRPVRGVLLGAMLGGALWTAILLLLRRLLG